MEKHWVFPIDHIGDESFRLATTDLMVPPIYSTYGLVFELCETIDRNSIIQWVKKGLEKTLSQCRNLVGTIEANQHGDFSVVKRRNSAVQLNVQWLDEANSISYSQLQKFTFSSLAFGDISKLLVDGITYGVFYPLEKSPTVSMMQLNFIPGGLIFTASLHHCVIDNAGFGGFIYQLAENCHSIVHQTRPPSWDIQFIDRSRFRCREFISAEQVSNIPPPELDPRPQPEHRPNTALLLHLPKSKEKSLKAAAKPPDGNIWISTYDAFAALLWRLVLKHRHKLYQVDLSTPAFFYEIVNMRSRLGLPARFQGNAILAPTTDGIRNSVTLSEVISDAPLWRLAMCIREITNTATAESLQNILDKAAMTADKTKIRYFDSTLTTMSLGITDVRCPSMYEVDFGFGRPRAFRHFFYPFIAESLVVVYPARPIDNNPDAGCEFLVPMEKDLVRGFLDDADVQRYFEFRGFEARPPDGF